MQAQNKKSSITTMTKKVDDLLKIQTTMATT